VADLVPPSRRGSGYGTFTAIYGLAWMGGGTAIGALYEHSVGSVQLFAIITQVVALVAFLQVRVR
jgi:MFS family permease